MEVVSDDPKDRERDYERKLADYAEAKIAEYWIVDFESQKVIVHQFHEGNYSIHGKFAPGERASSVLLEGFAVDVAALFAVADDIPE